MPHAKNKVWIHGVFSTKSRVPFLSSNIREEVYQMLDGQFKKLGCHMESIGGIDDHVHVLFLLNRDLTLSKVFHQVKGATSRFINLKKMAPDLFRWQIGYGAFSVSESKVPDVVRYIQNQEEHHKNYPYDQEYVDFLKRHGLPSDEYDFE
ncbi:MAG: IS200/IS605 family transposase [Saprospiraceae bacterium]